MVTYIVAALTAPEIFRFTIKNVALCINLDQCNLRCIMCWQTYTRESNRQVHQITNMKREHMLRLLRRRELRQATISVVGGGEPFLYPHINDILLEAPTQDRRLMIMTNGNLLSVYQMLWEAAENAAITLSFSIDAASQVTYEQIRKGGCWSELMGSIERAVALRERNPLLHISTSFVVIQQNLHELMEFMRLNALWGSEYVHIHPAIRGSFPDEWLVDTRSKEYQETIAEVVAFARTHSIALDPLEEIWPSQGENPSTLLTEQNTDSRGLNKNQPLSQLAPGDPRSVCHVHSDSMTLSVTGEVYLCDTAFRVYYPCGNVFTKGLLRVWLSPAWLSVRLAHKQGRQLEHPLCSRCLLVK